MAGPPGPSRLSGRDEDDEDEGHGYCLLKADGVNGSGADVLSQRPGARGA